MSRLFNCALEIESILVDTIRYYRRYRPLSPLPPVTVTASRRYRQSPLPPVAATACNSGQHEYTPANPSLFAPCRPDCSGLLDAGARAAVA